MERQTIIDLIHEHYDPEPKDWPRHRGWDDGSGDIADAILSRMAPKHDDLSQCPKCGLKAETNLYRFCTHQTCPVRSALQDLEAKTIAQAQER